MDKHQKIDWAKQKLAEMWQCDAAAFDSEHNVFLETADTFFEIATFGHNAVMRGNPIIMAWCAERFGSTLARWILDGDNYYLLETKLRSLGKKLAGEHVRYLHLFPDSTIKKPLGFTYKWYNTDTVRGLYEHKTFDNALNFERDVIAVAAYDRQGKLAAMAGADDRWGSMWQIGIDTLSEYRRLGLGVYLVKELALAIERGGKLPFYTTWGPNIASARVALGAGFHPVWMGYPSEDLSEGNLSQ
ncbi:MAG: GNAT family N-acetyltransferase [Clostridia bacterium]|nr:GNAT family N-acetyltransferase [Clostridia bacterium]